MRKLDSQRRWKARFMLGKPIPLMAIRQRLGLYDLMQKHPIEWDILSEVAHRKAAECPTPA